VTPDTFHLLSDGLVRLSRGDSGIDRLITPRREEIFSLLARYITEIELYNPSQSLVGTSERQELIIRHILDSLAPAGILARLMKGSGTPRVADIGSGAGLPGIPLAIVMPDAEFTLIERKGRRANFLRQTLAALDLANSTVEEAEMEKTQPGRFSLVTFRAFRPLEPKIFRKIFRLCEKGGCLAAYKGRREKIEAEMAALEKALPALAGHWELIPCPVPLLNEERHLLVIR
jgi:16S rRNA (guanine527-N7)-methyltransferase